MKLQIKALLVFLIFLFMIQCRKDNEIINSKRSFIIQTPNETNYFVDFNPDSILVADNSKIDFDTLVQDSIYKKTVSIALNYKKQSGYVGFIEPNLVFSISYEYSKHDKVNRTKVEFIVNTDYHVVPKYEPLTMDYYGTEVSPYELTEGALINDKMTWVAFGRLACLDKIEIPEYNQSMILENTNNFEKKESCKNYIAFRYKSPKELDYQYGWISLQIDSFNKLIIYSYLFEKNTVTNML